MIIAGQGGAYWYVVPYGYSTQRDGSFFATLACFFSNLTNTLAYYGMELYGTDARMAIL